MREYDSLNSNFKFREIKELFGVQNSVICERLDGVCEKISLIEKRVKDVESNSKPKHTEHDLLSSLPGPSKVVAQFSKFPIPDVDVDQIGQPSFCSGLNPLSKDFVPPSGPAETVSSGNLRGYDTSVDVAGFILRHSLLGDRNFRFSGNPVDYVEFTRHYQSCYASKIYDPDILMTCLLNMLEGKAAQAVRGYRQLPSSVALPKILEVLKTRFGQPERIQEAFKNKLLGAKKLKDDLECLTDFLFNLTNFKLMQEHVNRNNSISCGFMCSLIDLLPFRLRDTFLDKLACEGLLNSKDKWLDELVKFVEKQVESGLTGNRNQGSTDKGAKSNKLCFAFSNEKSSD